MGLDFDDDDDDFKYKVVGHCGNCGPVVFLIAHASLHNRSKP